VISLKKFLADSEAQSLIHVAQLLLRAMAQHAVEVDSDDYARFQSEIFGLADKLGNPETADEMVVDADRASKALEEYNRRTAQTLKRAGADLQEMVRMLTGTVSALATTGEDRLIRLRELEGQLESASHVDDVRILKLRLSECLGEIRKESERQKNETTRTVAELRQGIERARKGQSGSEEVLDPVTGLPGRAAAELAIAKGCEQDASTYGIAIRADRLQVFNARFGYDVGDQILRSYAEHLVRQLGSKDRLFRWTGPTLVAVIFRAGRPERVREEIGQVMERRYEHSALIGGRPMNLIVSSRWAMFPLTCGIRGKANGVPR